MAVAPLLSDSQLDHRLSETSFEVGGYIVGILELVNNFAPMLQELSALTQLDLVTRVPGTGI